MKQWQFDQLGLENLKQVDAPERAPGPNEVAVRVKAASLNYRDWDILTGGYAVRVPLPLVPASDASGEVIAVGTAVTRFRPGDRVVTAYRPAWIDGPATPEVLASSLGGPRQGVLSESIVIHEDGLLRVPAYLSLQEASTLPIAAVTAWNALVEESNLKAGETVLVEGSGGVSVFALQIAKALGAKVIATSSSDEKLKRLRALGADATVNYAKVPEWDKAVLDWTNGKGVNHVVEIAGGESLVRSVSASAIGGKIVMIGYLDGKKTTLSVPPLLGKQIRIQGISVGHRRSFERMLAAFEEHSLHPVIDRTYKFADTPEAFRHLGRGAFGKIVIEA